MTKNYWVKAALHRKKASSEQVSFVDVESRILGDSVLSKIEANAGQKAELEKLLCQYLDNYRELHKDLHRKKDNDGSAPKFKSVT